jgi:hypothetical protein
VTNTRVYSPNLWNRVSQPERVPVTIEPGDYLKLLGPTEGRRDGNGSTVWRVERGSMVQVEAAGTVVALQAGTLVRVEPEKPAEHTRQARVLRYDKIADEWKLTKITVTLHAGGFKKLSLVELVGEIPL